MGGEHILLVRVELDGTFRAGEVESLGVGVLVVSVGINEETIPSGDTLGGLGNNDLKPRRGLGVQSKNGGSGERCGDAGGEFFQLREGAGIVGAGGFVDVARRQGLSLEFEDPAGL